MSSKKLCPCIDCITMPSCKALVNEDSITSLRHKCTLLNEYLIRSDNKESRAFYDTKRLYKVLDVLGVKIMEFKNE